MAAAMKYTALEGLKLNSSNMEPSNAKHPNTPLEHPTEDLSMKNQASASMYPRKGERVSLLSRLEAYRTAYLALTPADNFDTALYKSVKIVSGTTHPSGTSGTATFRIAFPAQYCNKFGTVHGGAIATILDGVAQCSTAVVYNNFKEVASATFKGKGGVGATKALQVGYLRPITLGEQVIILCEVLKSGPQGAVIRGIMKRESDGEVLAICAMDKEGCEKAKL